MKTKILPFLIFISLGYSVFAQTDSLNLADSFTIDLPGKNAQHSLYTAIELFDKRDADSVDLGFIEHASFSKITTITVKPSSPLQKQLVDIINVHRSTAADSGKLLLQLYRFKFAEFSSLYKNERFFSLRANLYSVTEKGYHKIDQIDTIVSLMYTKKEKKIYALASNTVNLFIGRNLFHNSMAADRYYTFTEMANMDSIEKLQLKAYTSDTIVNGVYYSFESFKNQIPDYTDISVRIKNGNLKSVTKVNHTFNYDMDCTFPNVYAVVTDKKIFIYNDEKYYPLEKRGNDFFFISKINFSGSTSIANVLNFTGLTLSTDFFPYGTMSTIRNSAPLMIIGMAATLASFLTENPKKVPYELKIDHLDGSFIPVREIKKETEKENK